MQVRFLSVPLKNVSGSPSRKYSAIAVAVFAALLRINAGLSEVATTTTERAIPSGPRSRSMNSRTSRPRSPISAITLISALVFRANIPINVLFPTPEPAKTPIRCPFPTVISPSTALTPSGSLADDLSCHRVWRHSLYRVFHVGMDLQAIGRSADAIECMSEHFIPYQNR